MDADRLNCTSMYLGKKGSMPDKMVALKQLAAMRAMKMGLHSRRTSAWNRSGMARNKAIIGELHNSTSVLTNLPQRGKESYRSICYTVGYHFQTFHKPDPLYELGL